jgi:hypothetical protein
MEKQMSLKNMDDLCRALRVSHIPYQNQSAFNEQKEMTKTINGIEIFNPIEHGIHGQPLMVPAHEYNKLLYLSSDALRLARNGRYCAEDLVSVCNAFDTLEVAITPPNAPITGPGEKPFSKFDVGKLSMGARVVVGGRMGTVIDAHESAEWIDHITKSFRKVLQGADIRFDDDPVHAFYVCVQSIYPSNAPITGPGEKP